MGLFSGKLFQKQYFIIGFWFVLTVVFVASGFGQSNSSTPISSSVTPKATQIIHMHKLGWREEKQMGLSSANAPERYIREVMFKIQTLELVNKYGSTTVPLAKVDGKENVYLSFCHAVIEFDRNGKQVRVLKNSSPKSWNIFFVDEEGNLFIREYKIENGGRVTSHARVFNFNGLLIDQPTIQDPPVFEKDNFRFSHGVIFSKKTGEMIYKIPGADEKILPNIKIIPLVKNKFYENPQRHFIENNGNEYNFPNLIDGCDFGWITDVDSSGTSMSRIKKIRRYIRKARIIQPT